VLDDKARESGKFSEGLNQFSHLYVSQPIAVQVDLLQNIGERLYHFGQTVAHFWRHVVFIERQFQIYYLEKDGQTKYFFALALLKVPEHLIVSVIVSCGRFHSIFAQF
jgi:hypothetical protein